MPRHEESIFRLIEEGTIEPHTVVPNPAPSTDGRHHQTAVHERKGAAKSQPQHQNSSQVASFLKPTYGIRDLQARHGITPKNHAKDNLVAIREKSSQNQLKKMESELPSPKKKAYSASKFAPPTPGEPPKAKGNLFSAGVENNGRDYVNENITVAARAAKKQPMKDMPKISDVISEPKHGNFGKVPSYLKDRNAELALKVERRRQAAEAQLIPEGMMLLSEGERLQTLTQLAETKKEVETQLYRLPFTCETPSQIRHKQNVETRLKEIEDAVKVFSRTKVFVRTDH
mmetsp:Transcript_33969/g.57059  ORF Transcript_33969/g.57059 Transcript_33969/m.57059 type:complete len:286 (-) Transcript_33969:1033-1890(-)